MSDLTGPIPDHVAADLEALKLRLVCMEVPDLPEERAEAIGREISAIRLQLKRLEFDRATMARRAAAP